MTPLDAEKGPAVKKTTALFLALFLLVCPLFAACARLPYPYEKLKAGRTPPQLDRSLIRSVWCDVYLLTDKEIDELIRLYNGSVVQNNYGGTTPNFSYEIFFTDGSILSLSENCVNVIAIYMDENGTYAPNPTDAVEYPAIAGEALFAYLRDLEPVVQARAETAADLPK